MLKTILEYNNAKLELLGYFRTTFGLTDRVVKQMEEGVDIYPAVYCGNGEFMQVTQFDYECGLAYWRKVGDVGWNKSNAQSLIGGKQLMELTYPLRLIISVPREKLSVDDSYASERLVNSIGKSLNENNGALKSALQVRTIEVTQASWSDNLQEIFSDEFTGIDLTYSYKYLLLRIDYNVRIEVNQSCLEQECPYPIYECDILSRMVNAKNRRDCILPEFDFSTDADFDALSEQQILDLTNRLCP